MGEEGERGGVARLDGAWWVLLAYWALMYLGTHWPEIERYKPQTGWWIPFFGEVVHFSLYAVWAALWWWVLHRGGRRASGRAALLLICGGAIYALFDEVTQPLVGRSGKLDDVLVDVTGVAVTVSVLWVLRGRLGAGVNGTGEKRKRG